MNEMHPDERLINDYVDDGLDEGARAAVARHLEQCTECSQLVNDLLLIVSQAAVLEPMQPPDRAWMRITAALRESSNAAQRVPRRSVIQPAQRSRGWFAWQPMFIGLAAAVLLITAAVGALFVMRHSVNSSQVAQSDTRQLTESIEAELGDAEQHYQKAIDGLEQITSTARNTLDPATEDTLVKNLAVIDRAISASRAALKSNPGSVAAQYTLLEGLKAKVALLQETVTLMNELRRDGDSGSAPADADPHKRG